MSWPHVLSLSRVIAGPIVAGLILSKPGNAYLIAALVFAVSSASDLVDGKLARYSRSVSPFGVFLDTTADKVLVSMVLISLAIAGLTPAWPALIIIGREFLISGLRSYAASRNRIISAHTWGKGKAAITMIAIFLLLVAAGGRAGGSISSISTHSFWQDLFDFGSWLLYFAAILTVVSGLRYFVDAWPLFRADPEVPEVPARPPTARNWTK
jgi:CDP-diacylglycerol--glycerol-3-phosphate 3-phosphatidyltransferase